MRTIKGEHSFADWDELRPQNDFSALKRLMHVDNALIFAALPMQLDIAKLLDIRTVYNHVDEGQEGKLVSEALDKSPVYSQIVFCGKRS